MKEIIEKIIREAGQMMLDAVRPEVFTKEGHANFVTETDAAVQKFLEEKLSAAFPEAHFLAEEEDVHHLSDEMTFIIDPIDGTTNFIRARECSMISIGIVKNRKAFFGMLYQPYQDRLYYAERGKGAWCNGEPLKCAEMPKDKCLIEFGSSPYDPTLAALSAESMKNILKEFADIRRSGSAAFDLCALACGRSDGMFEWVLQPWDYCAASVLVEEAGGHCGNIMGGEITFEKGIPFMAGSDTAFEALRTVLQKTAADFGYQV